MYVKVSNFNAPKALLGIGWFDFLRSIQLHVLFFMSYIGFFSNISTIQYILRESSSPRYVLFRKRQQYEFVRQTRPPMIGRTCE